MSSPNRLERGQTQAQQYLELLDISAPEVKRRKSELVQMLKESTHSRNRAAACRALGQLSPDDLAAYSSDLVRSLEDKEADVQQAACETLGKLSCKDLAEQASALVKKLDDSEAEKLVQHAALESLIKLSEDDLAHHSETLVRVLNRKDPSSCQVALKGVCNLPPRYLSKYISTMFEMLQDEEPVVKSRASEVLSKVHLEDLATHFSELELMLNHDNLALRVEALKLMVILNRAGKFPPGRNWKAEQLVQFLSSPEPLVRQGACESMGKLASSELAENSGKVMPLLQDKIPDVRDTACDTLGQLPLHSLYGISVEIYERLDENQASPRGALSELKTLMHESAVEVKKDSEVKNNLGVLLLPSAKSRAQNPQVSTLSDHACIQLSHMPLRSKVFKLQPEGTRFAEPVQLVVPLEGEANVAFYSEDGATDTSWKKLEAVNFLGSHSQYMEVRLKCDGYFYASWEKPKKPMCPLQCLSSMPCFRPKVAPAPEQMPPLTSPVPQPNVGPAPGPAGRWAMLSARFNKPDLLRFVKQVKELLEKRVPTYMVDNLSPGDSFAVPTMKGLYYARMMVAFCCEDYGAVTGARYETYHELRYAWEKEKKIVPVQLCEDFPPRPPDETGRIQNDFVLSSTILRIVDGKSWRTNSRTAAKEVADQLVQAWEGCPPGESED